MATIRTAKGIGEINVTPLIDVLLVLLIIFMVIAPTGTAGLPVVIPQKTNELQRDTRERAIVIRIGSDQSVTINFEATDMERLSSRLAEIFSSRGERAVFVQGDRDLEFQHVARAIDSAKAAGIHTIGLLSERL